MFFDITGEILYGLITDRGLCRNVNQDALKAFTAGSLGLFVLSDGMGGHSRGELASNAIVESFSDYWKELGMLSQVPDFNTVVQQLQIVIQKSNQNVFEQYNQGQVCGATLVVLLIYYDCYAVFWVGDSRIYSMCGRKFGQITVDDVWENQPFIVQNFEPEEIMRHESYGMLTQAIGPKLDIVIHVNSGKIQKGQKFLLCSDGLFKFCDEKGIKKLMSKAQSEKSIQDALEKMKELVFENGAGDNVSMILVRVV